MERIKRTHPGTWRLFNKGGVISVYAKNKEVIKWTGFDSSDYPKDALANARFIVLADHHFDALKTALKSIVDLNKFQANFGNRCLGPRYTDYSEILGAFGTAIGIAEAALAKIAQEEAEERT
jgi:hypothetical protein